MNRFLIHRLTVWQIRRFSSPNNVLVNTVDDEILHYEYFLMRLYQAILLFIIEYKYQNSQVFSERVPVVLVTA
jgi:hypothetical protein